MTSSSVNNGNKSNDSDLPIASSKVEDDNGSVVANNNSSMFSTPISKDTSTSTERPEASRRPTFDYDLVAKTVLTPPQISENLAKLKLNSSLPIDSSFPTSENPSALSLNYELSSDLGVEPSRIIKHPTHINLPGGNLQDYSTDQTSSPDYDERSITNQRQSILSTFGEDQDLVSVGSSQALTMDDENSSSSLSSETRENVALGKTSYLNDVNYIRDHLDFLNQNLNASRSARNSDSKYSDFASISPDIIPCYSLVKQFGNRSYQTNLLYHGIKVGHTGGVDTENFTCKLASEEKNFIEVNSKVVLSISPNIMKNLSLSRLLNEWFILSGTNPPKTHLLWSNETLTNKFIPNSKRPTLQKDKKYGLNTLPVGIPGILYPVEILSFSFENELDVGSADRKGEAQKRVALVYNDNDYKTLREYSCGTPEPHPERTSSDTSNGSGVRSVMSGNSTAQNTPSESLEQSHSFFNGIGAIGATSSTNSLFNKLAEHVTSSPKTPLKVIEIISDMIKVVETLGVVHELGFVHNGITSMNLLKSENDQDDVKITGWEFAFCHMEDCIYGYRKNHLNEISDLIPYMAPEVSGVVNQMVDHRSDFYSIGIVLYELLLGTLPFQSEDPNSIVRMHIFQKPVAPHLLAPSWVSEKLGTTIMRCLEKNPSDRYIDCYSLLSDLILIKNQYIDRVSSMGELVWNHWKKTGDFDVYLNKEKMKSPEKVGHSPTFTFPAKFVGRDEVYKEIFDIYNNTFEGGVNLFWISGVSGVGKTIILNDMRVGAFFKYDFYCMWKFSCSDTGNSIYSMLLEGIKTVIGQILECSEEIQDSWRDLIVTNIPLDLSILFYLIPQLRKLLGPKYISIYQHKSGTSSPGGPIKEEATSTLEVKFRAIIRSFYKVVGLQGLTIFIDDLHWCSEESWQLLCDMLKFDDESDISEMSLKLVATFTTDARQFQENIDSVEKEKRFKDYVNRSSMKMHVFDIPKVPGDAYKSWIVQLIGANSSSSKTHIGGHHAAAPQQSSMSSMINKATTEQTTHKLSGANNKLIADALKFYDATGGNIMLAQYAISMARFSQHCYYLSLHNYGRFVVDNLSPENYGMNRNEIIQNFLNATLTPDVKCLLEFAAIISQGPGFHLSDLIVASAMPMDRAFKALSIMVGSKLLLPTTTYYKVPFDLLCSTESPFDLTDNDIWELTSHCSYRFFYDSLVVHITADLVTTDRYKELSRLCALRFHKTISKEKTLNIGGYLQMAGYFRNSYQVARSDEKELYIEVLVQAGRYASSTYNMKLAQKLFQVVGELVDDLDSTRQLKSILTVSQNHYYFGEYEKCLEVMARAQEKYGFDRIVFLYQLVRCKIQMGEIEEAIKISFESLPKLGITISADEEQNLRDYKKYKAKIPVSVPDIRNIPRTKPTESPKLLLIYHLISQLLPSLVVFRKNASRKLLVVQAMHAIYKHGPSPFAFMIMIDFASDFASQFTSAGLLKAKELCRVAISLINRANNVSINYYREMYDVYVCTLAVYVEPMPVVLKYIEIISEKTQNDMMSGFEELRIVLGMIDIFILLLGGKAYDMSFSVNRRKSQREKIGLSEERLFIFDSEDCVLGSLSVSDYRARYEEKMINEQNLSQSSYLVVVLNGLMVAKRYDEGVDLILNKAHEVFESSPLLFYTSHYFYVAAILITFASKGDAEAEAKKTAIFNDIYLRMKLWASTNEHTFGNRVILLSALNAIREGSTDSLSILDIFEDAIEHGSKVQNWYDVSWISVFCARWLINCNGNKRRIGQLCKRAIEIMRKRDFEDFARQFEEEFEKYLEQDWSMYTWAGINSAKQQEEKKKPSKNIPSNLPISTDDSVSEEMKSQMKLNRKSRKARHKVKSNKNSNSAYDLNSTIQACLGISEASDERTILIELLTCAIKFAEVDYGVVVYMNGEPKIQAVGSAQHIYTLNEEPLSSRIDVCPYRLLIHVLETGETINKEDDHVAFANRFGKDPYYNYNSCSTILCVALKNQFGVFGALYLEVDSRRDKKKAIFDGRKRDLLHLFCTQAAVAMGKARLISQMEIAKMAAEDATAEKASFLANMSHEIRTPFNSLLSCSIFLLDTPLNSTQREYVEAIKSSAMVTLNIIDGILAFSKIEHGSFTLENSPFSLNDCIESAIQLGGEQVVDNNLELVFFNNCPQINTVTGDVTRVRQIIINLVGNAMKFTTHGHIIISCNAAELTSVRYEVTISVEDTGIGIPEQSHNKVFGAFSQVDGSSRREFGGSGLGLAISKKLADLMGGDIRFESQEGVGSTFYFNVSFGVSLFDKPEIDLSGKRALILNKLELTGAALKNMLTFFNLFVDDVSTAKDIKSVESYDFLFINLDEYDEFSPFESQLKSSAKVVILAQFGKPLTGESSKYEALLCPFQRERVVRLLRDARPETKPREITPALLADEYPLRILLAEDNLLNYKVALKYLEKLGFKADHAKDGTEVLKKCDLLMEKGEKYDVILMDIQMPNKDGITATKELLANYTKLNKQHLIPKIVALTANVAGDDRERCIECGMIDFVSKPILPNELKRVLTNLGEIIQEEKKAETASNRN
ncbi:CHK1 [Candida theae]|uniref:histidine kinase n=1 Tax=Candida theae TaxID=1198502 RepID=A0AAD5FX35_9ASCO|nr:CHK1 [Candida theae]KAI5950021.1 CHK1 [Candida theae]